MAVFGRDNLTLYKRIDARTPFNGRSNNGNLAQAAQVWPLSQAHLSLEEMSVDTEYGTRYDPDAIRPNSVVLDKF